MLRILGGCAVTATGVETHVIVDADRVSDTRILSSVNNCGLVRDAGFTDLNRPY